MASSRRNIDPRRLDYLVDSERKVVYKIISKNPIGRATDNVPVYRVVYSVLPDDNNQSKFVDEFLSVKKVSFYDSNSIKPFSKLLALVYKSKGMETQENLLLMHSHFVDKETEALCVVMPFAERGSLRSIMADKFPTGLPEIFIVVVLRSLLKALSFLHRKNILHGNVNPGHIYVQTGPKILLGFRATIYEHGISNIECSSDSALPAIEISKWGAAPEVYCDLGIGDKRSDIWLVGITALELAYGGIRVPDRESLDMLLWNIIQTRRLPRNFQVEKRKEDTEEERRAKGKQKMETTKGPDLGERVFSREFEWMVAECLALNYEDRPTASQLLNHEFFTNQGLSEASLESRFQDFVIQKIKCDSIKPSSGRAHKPKSHISIPGRRKHVEPVNMDLTLANRPQFQISIPGPAEYIEPMDMDMDFTPTTSPQPLLPIPGPAEFVEPLNVDYSFANSLANRIPESHISIPGSESFDDMDLDMYFNEDSFFNEDLSRRDESSQIQKPPSSPDESSPVKKPIKLCFKRNGDDAKKWGVTAVESSDNATDAKAVDVSTSLPDPARTDNYLVDPDFNVVYEIMSNDPIGTGSDNIHLYRVAYSECEGDPYRRKFIYDKPVSAKRLDPLSNSVAYVKLWDDLENRNRALPSDHENLIPVEDCFSDSISHDFCITMPFVEFGSLRSIMADHFPDGFPEICISVALKPVLEALSFLHGLDFLHRDINAGHVYVKSGPKIMLGFAATVHEIPASNPECSTSSALPQTRISNWAAAPEVYRNVNHYTQRADIWLVGILALELAYGGIKVPNRDALEVMIRGILEKRRLPKKCGFDREEVSDELTENKEEKGKKIMDDLPDSEERTFSKEFEDFVVECLAWNPGERPTAATLLQHEFFTKDEIQKATLDSHFHSVVIEKCKK